MYIRLRLSNVRFQHFHSTVAYFSGSAASFPLTTSRYLASEVFLKNTDVLQEIQALSQKSYLINLLSQLFYILLSLYHSCSADFSGLPEGNWQLVTIWPLKAFSFSWRSHRASLSGDKTWNCVIFSILNHPVSGLGSFRQIFSPWLPAF